MTDEKTQKDPNHWIADEGNRRAFWAKVKDEFGLTEQQVHAALEVDSLYDTTYKRAAVESQLRWYAKGHASGTDAHHLQEFERQDLFKEWYDMCSELELAEAPASINTNICTPDGYNAQVTLRDKNEARLIERFFEATSSFEQLGFLPCNRYGDPVTMLPQATVQQAFQEQAAHDQTKAPPTGPPSPAQGPPTGNGAPQGNGGGVYDDIEQVKVVAPRGNAVIEFWKPGRRFSEIRHNLGAEDLLKKSPQLVAAGWTVEHFTIGADFAAKLNVYWSPSDNLKKDGTPYENITKVELR